RCPRPNSLAVGRDRRPRPGAASGVVLPRFGGSAAADGTAYEGVSVALGQTSDEIDARAVLRIRAERLARPRDATPGQQAEGSELAVAEFRLGDERYALPLMDLRAALPLRH